MVLLIGACSPGRKLATRFVMQEDNLHVLIIPPSGLLKHYYPSDPMADTTGTLQPLPVGDSKFLAGLNDTAFVNYFMRSLRFHLQQLRIHVYGPENIDSFFQIDTVAYMFSVAQLELIEFDDEHIEMSMLDTTLYRVALPRTNIEKSTWFEFSEVNNHERSMEVLYSMQRTSDYFEGRFHYDWRSGELTYRYTPYYMEEPDVYDLAYFSGKKNAQYIFDHLMNLYIQEQARSSRATRIYFQYDAEQHAIRRAFDDRFIRIPQQTEQDPD